MDWMPIPALGGVNLFDDPRAIRDEEVQWAKNLAPIVPGILSKRGGLSRPYTLAPTIEYAPSAAVMSPLSQSLADMVVAGQGISNTVLIGVQFSGVDTPLLMPFVHPRVFLLAWGSKVYALPGPYAQWTGPSQAPFYTYDTTVDNLTATNATPVVFSGAGNDLVYPAVAAPYKQRLVLANFGKGYENTIVFTDNYSATVVGDNVLAVNARNVNLVAAADGDEIVAMVEVMLTAVGSPATSGLLILRKYGNPFLLTGEPDQTTGGTNSLSIQRISVNAGCAGPYTVVKTPVGIVWAGIDDVWCFAQGVVPYRIGQKIQPALAKTPIQLQYRWSAAYFKGFYRLAVWGAGQPMTATDAPGDQWWLDLREGLPQDWRSARWWGPQQFLGGAAAGTAPRPQTWCIVPENRAGKEPKLYYVDSTLAGGIQATTVGEYGPDPRDMTSPASAIADKDYVDPEVTVLLKTKEYALAPALLQANDGVMMVVRPSDDLRLSLDVIADDGGQTVTVTKDVPPQGFLLGANTLGTSVMNNKATAVALYPQPRPTGQTIRFELSDVAGYDINSNNDTLVIGVGPYTANPDQRLLTIAHGSYTLAQLIVALNAAQLVDANGTSHGTLSSNDTGASVTLGLNASGKVQFDDSADITQMACTLNFVDNTTISNAFATAAQLLVSSRLGGILGLDTSQTNNFTGDGASSGPGPASNTIIGITAPFKKGISSFELYGVQANMEIMPRTP